MPEQGEPPDPEIVLATWTTCPRESQHGRHADPDPRLGSPAPPGSKRRGAAVPCGPGRRPSAPRRRWKDEGTGRAVPRPPPPCGVCGPGAIATPAPSVRLDGQGIVLSKGGLAGCRDDHLLGEFAQGQKGVPLADPSVRWPSGELERLDGEFGISDPPGPPSRPLPPSFAQLDLRHLPPTTDLAGNSRVRSRADRPRAPSA